MIAQAMGAAPGQETNQVRSRVTNLHRRGELERVEDGVFRYLPSKQPRGNAESCQRVWRAVRASKPGFGVTDIVLATRYSERVVRKYLRWLLREGYLAKHGRKGNQILYRATLKARDTVSTPYPPNPNQDPFKRERDAACALVRLFMERDPYQPHARRSIVENCLAILDRFDPNKVVETCST